MASEEETSIISPQSRSSLTPCGSQARMRTATPPDGHSEGFAAPCEDSLDIVELTLLQKQNIVRALKSVALHESAVNCRRTDGSLARVCGVVAVDDDAQVTWRQLYFYDDIFDGAWKYPVPEDKMILKLEGDKTAFLRLPKKFYTSEALFEECGVEIRPVPVTDYGEEPSTLPIAVAFIKLGCQKCNFIITGCEMCKKPKTVFSAALASTQRAPASLGGLMKNSMRRDAAGSGGLAKKRTASGYLAPHSAGAGSSRTLAPSAKKRKVAFVNPDGKVFVYSVPRTRRDDGNSRSAALEGRPATVSRSDDGTSRPAALQGRPATVPRTISELASASKEKNIDFLVQGTLTAKAKLAQEAAAIEAAKEELARREAQLAVDNVTAEKIKAHVSQQIQAQLIAATNLVRQWTQLKTHMVDTLESLGSDEMKKEGAGLIESVERRIQIELARKRHYEEYLIKLELTSAGN